MRRHFRYGYVRVCDGERCDVVQRCAEYMELDDVRVLKSPGAAKATFQAFKARIKAYHEECEQKLEVGPCVCFCSWSHTLG